MMQSPTPLVQRPAPGVLATSLDSVQSFPRHSHETYGIGRMRRGAQRSWSAAGWVEAGPGDLVMVNPGEVHDGHPMGGEARSWQMLYLAPTLVEKAASEMLVAGRTLPLWRPVARDAPLAKAFERLHRRLLAQAGALACDEAQVALLATLFARHATLAPMRVGTPSIAHARQRLDDDPSNDPGLSALASEAGVSRFQMLRAFARELDMTPHAYLIQRRLAKARSLLDAGASIADAAVAAGFSDQAHLTRLFRRSLGFTPAAYARSRSRSP